VSLAFSVCGQEEEESSGCDFRVGVGCFSVRGPAPSFPWECFVVVATLGSWACGENVCGLAFFQW